MGTIAVRTYGLLNRSRSLQVIAYCPTTERRINVGRPGPREKADEIKEARCPDSKVRHRLVWMDEAVKLLANA